MHYTIERLMKGDAHVTGHYVAAKQRWAEILRNVDDIDVATLAQTPQG